MRVHLFMSKLGRLRLSLTLALLLALPASGQGAKPALLDSVRPLQIFAYGELRNVCSVGSLHRERRLWLTAQHCLLAQDLWVDGSPAVVVASSEAEDLAILFTPQLEPPRPLKLSLKPPKVGDKTEAGGFPLGTGPVLFPGRVLLPKWGVPSVTQQFILFSAPACVGSSGSPVVNKKGELISVVQRILTTGDNCSSLSLGASFEALTKFVAPFL